MNTPWWLTPCKPVDHAMSTAAAERQQQLTKPAGSLGQLEALAVQLAGLQGRLKPRADQIWVAIFAGDHGVVAEGVSAYPQAVTGQMLHNFVSGGAAISVLARQLGAQLDVAHLTGPGTGLDAAGVSHKARVIDQALAFHDGLLDDPLQTLFRLGGFEIAALAGAYVACAQEGLVALVDGFICTVAAMVAVRLNPECREWLIFAHRGAEQGHRHVLESLQAQPLLDLGLRLGEGSGAALAVPLVRLACDLHGQMATFAEASVADRPA